MADWKALLFALACLVCVPAAGADLVGHGGPVRAMAISADGSTLVTASFDSTVIRWSLRRSSAVEVKRFHTGAVNTVIMLPSGHFASAGEDGVIAIWEPAQAAPVQVLTGHTGPVVALAVSGDGLRLASASWDGTARVWQRAGGSSFVLGAHGGNVNGVGFLPNGQIVTAAYDGKLRYFSAGSEQMSSVETGVPLSVLAVAPDGETIVGAADGHLRLFDQTGRQTGQIAVASAPLASLAVSSDGRLLAAAGFRGVLAIVDRQQRTVRRTLDGPAFPVWSLAFAKGNTEILTGGANRIVRRWSVETGEPLSLVDAPVEDGLPAQLRSHPGAAVFGACAACHTLDAAADPRAGPTLAGLFGRRIGTAAGYDYSPALRAMDIVWTPETVQRLFEIGPMAYTPGTKMPEQKILRAEDRQSLVEFLQAAQK